MQCTSTLLLKGEEFVRDVRTSRIAFRALCTFLHGLATTSNNLDSVRYTKIEKIDSEGAAREWSTVVIVIVIFINCLLF